MSCMNTCAETGFGSTWSNNEFSLLYLLFAISSPEKRVSLVSNETLPSYCKALTLVATSIPERPGMFLSRITNVKGL